MTVSELALPTLTTLPNSATAGERRIFDLWNACDLQGQADFPPGQLIQCLKRLERAI
jgi:hypothetical protein